MIISMHNIKKCIVFFLLYSVNLCFAPPKRIEVTYEGVNFQEIAQQIGRDLFLASKLASSGPRVEEVLRHMYFEEISAFYAEEFSYPIWLVDTILTNFNKNGMTRSSMNDCYLRDKDKAHREKSSLYGQVQEGCKELLAFQKPMYDCDQVFYEHVDHGYSEVFQLLYEKAGKKAHWFRLVKLFELLQEKRPGFLAEISLDLVKINQREFIQIKDFLSNNIREKDNRSFAKLAKKYPALTKLKNIVFSLDRLITSPDEMNGFIWSGIIEFLKTDKVAAECLLDSYKLENEDVTHLKAYMKKHKEESSVHSITQWRRLDILTTLYEEHMDARLDTNKQQVEEYNQLLEKEKNNVSNMKKKQIAREESEKKEQKARASLLQMQKSALTAKLNVFQRDMQLIKNEADKEINNLRMLGIELLYSGLQREWQEKKAAIVSEAVEPLYKTHWQRFMSIYHAIKRKELYNHGQVSKKNHIIYNYSDKPYDQVVEEARKRREESVQIFKELEVSANKRFTALQDVYRKAFSYYSAAQQQEYVESETVFSERSDRQCIYQEEERMFHEQKQQCALEYFLALKNWLQNQENIIYIQLEQEEHGLQEIKEKEFNNALQQHYEAEMRRYEQELFFKRQTNGCVCLDCQQQSLAQRLYEQNAKCVRHNPYCAKVVTKQVK